MPDYLVFGGVLRSHLSFPELAAARDGTPRWVLTGSDHAAQASPAAALGSEPVEPGVQVTLYEHDRGLSLAFDDTGSFEISADGGQICWYPPPNPDLEAVRKDLLGRVLAICLHQQGALALHGSAVALGSEAIAFLAPKFHGKSTTAAALVDAGWLPLADDLVAVSTGSPPMVLPGMPAIQLWRDSAARVGSGGAEVQEEADNAKIQRRWDPAPGSRPEGTPLSAIYLLAPVDPKGEAAVRRKRLSAVEAALALLGQLKVGQLLGAARRARMLQRTGDLADRVPVYRLEIPRDFARIPELTETLRRWHTPPAGSTGGGRSG